MSYELTIDATVALIEILDWYGLNESFERYLRVEQSFEKAFEKIAKSPYSNSKWEDNPVKNKQIRVAIHFKIF